MNDNVALMMLMGTLYSYNIWNWKPHWNRARSRFEVLDRCKIDALQSWRLWYLTR